MYIRSEDNAEEFDAEFDAEVEVTCECTGIRLVCKLVMLLEKTVIG